MTSERDGRSTDVHEGGAIGCWRREQYEVIRVVGQDARRGLGRRHVLGEQDRSRLPIEYPDAYGFP